VITVSATFNTHGTNDRNVSAKQKQGKQGRLIY